jgi:hypothetical protein
MNDFIEAYVKKYEAKDQQFRIHFERLKQENLRIETVARDREHQLQLLSNPEGVKKYKDLLTNFTKVLTDNEDEKKNQLEAMSQMLVMIKECKLEVPKQRTSGFVLKPKISDVNIEKFSRLQKTLSGSQFDDKSYAKSASMINPVSPLGKLKVKKLASATMLKEDLDIMGKKPLIL